MSEKNAVESNTDPIETRGSFPLQRLVSRTVPKHRWRPFNWIGDKEDEHLERAYECWGLGSDWKIEKRTDTIHPWLLKTISGKTVYGCFRQMRSAKIAAILFECG